jgi:transposase
MAFVTRGVELSDHPKSSIIGSYRSGMIQARIAELYQVSLNTVKKLIFRYNHRGDANNARRPGRPLKIHSRTSRLIIREIHNNRRIPAAGLIENLPEKICEKTLRTHLHSKGYYGRIARVKPYLLERHKSARMNWARAHQQWTQEMWDRVIWTDECSVEIGAGGGQIRVWRRADEEYLSTCIAPSFKSSRTSVMIWSCMIAGKVGPIIVIPKDRRTGKDYVDLILDGPLWDFYTESNEEKGIAIVMEDGAPVHRSMAARKWRELNEVENLPWPAQSPDLNPIEHVWKILKHKLRHRSQRPRNQAELIAAIKESWKEISPEQTVRLVGSMPDRIKAVIKQRGGCTHY